MDSEKLVDEHIAARMLGVSVRSLRNFRYYETSPIPYYRILNRTIRYKIADIENHIKSRKVTKE